MEGAMATPRHMDCTIPMAFEGAEGRQ